MSLQRNTVAIPFQDGIDPSTPGRLLDPQKLLVAQNCSYILRSGPVKRNGHAGFSVKNNAAFPGLNGISPPTAPAYHAPFSTANPGLPTSWLYGWGIRGTELQQTTDVFEVSPQPNAGLLFGAATRDQEVLTWDGHRTFSYAANQASNFGQTQLGTAAATTRGPSCMPSMTVEACAKAATSQTLPDAADNGTLRLVCWKNPDGISFSYSVYDSSNKACLVSNQRVVLQSAKSLRCITVDGWFHMLCSDSTANSLEMRSFQQDTPNTVISRSLGAVDNQFDVKKIDETQFVVVKSKAGVIVTFVFNQDGSISSQFNPSLTGNAAATNAAIACEIDVNKNIGILWQTAGPPIFAVFGVYNANGAVIASPFTVASPATARRMTLAPRVTALMAGANVLWDIYIEDLVSSIAQVSVFTVNPNNSTSTTQVTRFRIVLASHAFRVGNRSFVWVASWLTGTPGLQNTWFLCDASLAPVGKMAYGLAAPDLGTTLNVLTSVNWHMDDPMQPYKDRIVFHGALPYNQRVPTQNQSAVPNGVFAETSINFYKLDFLRELRFAQAGRTTFFAGAQLWAYDGEEVVESGFHMAPEGVTLANTAGGALSAGVYRYRVDLCHKNAQNEEIRSWSIITAPVTASANDKITLTIPGMPMTRRENSYFLIFRTAAAGQLYNLVNSRDPTSANFLANSLTSATFSYVDALSDAAIAVREYHPANAGGNYIDPLPPPACEIVASGRDRLWVAGGELAPGEAAPSRLFFPGQAPAFSPALNIQVDRNAEPITALGFVGEVAAIFRRTSTYMIDSDGPDNSFNGAWPSARLVLADTGAVSQEGLALTFVGLWFQSPAGLRLLSPSGQMDPNAGTDVNPVTVGGIYAAAVVVPQYTQVRWYSHDPAQPTVVLDYSNNAWSLWTGLTCAGAVFWSVSNLAVIIRADGYVWVERTGLYTDNGSPYEMITKTAWLRATQLGDFQRLRRFALFGSAVAPLNLRVRIYYDERPFWDEQMIVNFPTPDGVSQGVFNSSLWGGVGHTWGSGAWGDDETSDNSGLYFRDNVFKFRRRPQRQKCSVFSIEFSDQGATNAGFVPVALGLELGQKPGLDRIPTSN